MCLCPTYMLGDLQDLKRASDSPELEVQMVVSHHACAGN